MYSTETTASELVRICLRLKILPQNWLPFSYYTATSALCVICLDELKLPPQNLFSPPFPLPAKESNLNIFPEGKLLPNRTEPSCPLYGRDHGRKIKTEENAKVVAAGWGKYCRTRYFPPGSFWRKGYFAEWMLWKIIWSSGSHPTKMDVIPKPFVKIILVTKWLVRHSTFKYAPQKIATTFAFSSVFIVICVLYVFS